MRLEARVSKLERSRPTEERCPACGDIDPATRSGPFSPGLMVPQEDGTCLCMCKLCARSFRARLEEDADGTIIAHDVVLDVLPI